MTFHGVPKVLCPRSLRVGVYMKHVHEALGVLDEVMILMQMFAKYILR